MPSHDRRRLKGALWGLSYKDIQKGFAIVTQPNLPKAPPDILTLGIRFQQCSCCRGHKHSVYSVDHLDQSVLAYKFDYNSLRVRGPESDHPDLSAGSPTYQLCDFEQFISF